MSKRVKAGTSKASAAQRRALFVEEFIKNGGNATQAAIKVGYSPKTAQEQSSRLLSNVMVKAAIEQRRTDALTKAQIKTDLTVEGTLRELHGIVHSDLRKCFDEKGALLPPHKWPDEVARAMASVKVVEMAGGASLGGEAGLQHVPMYTKEVKFWDKNAGIDKAMKHLGLFERDNEQKPQSVVHIAGAKSVKFEPLRGRGK